MNLMSEAVELVGESFRLPRGDPGLSGGEGIDIGPSHRQENGFRLWHTDTISIC